MDIWNGLPEKINWHLERLKINVTHCQENKKDTYKKMLYIKYEEGSTSSKLFENTIKFFIRNK